MKSIDITLMFITQIVNTYIKEYSLKNCGIELISNKGLNLFLITSSDNYKQSILDYSNNYLKGITHMEIDKFNFDDKTKTIKIFFHFTYGI